MSLFGQDDKVRITSGSYRGCEGVITDLGSGSEDLIYYVYSDGKRDEYSTFSLWFPASQLELVEDLPVQPDPDLVKERLEAVSTEALEMELARRQLRERVARQTMLDHNCRELSGAAVKLRDVFADLELPPQVAAHLDDVSETVDKLIDTIADHLTESGPG